MSRGLARVCLVLLGLVLAVPPRARAQNEPLAPEQREEMAREAFALGKYPEALALYGKLYAQILHPVYLRNIGRCYQKMGEPEKAIDAFREYLRKAEHVSPEQRAETEGFIAEMEQLRRARAAQAAPPAPPPHVVGADEAVLAPSAAEPAGEGPGRSLRLGGMITAGAGFLALGTGAYFGLRTRSLDDSVSHAGKFDATDDGAGQTAQTLQFAFYGVGAAALVGGAVLYYLGRDTRAALTVLPAIAPSQIGLQLALRVR